MSNVNASKIIRRTHMYLALFLTPWMIIYSLSGLVLNHNQTVRNFYGGDFNPFVKVEESEFTGTFSDNADSRAVAGQILEQLNLSGAFNVQGGPSQPKMVINRNGSRAAHRVTYFPKEKKLLIEKQTLNVPMFLNRAHFRNGYDQPFAPSKIWAVTVDLAVAGMLFWVASGIWMWWEIKPARLLGAGFALLGFAMFGVLLATI